MGRIYCSGRILGGDLDLDRRGAGCFRHLPCLWFPSVPALVWVVLFSVLLLLINLRSVGNYARFEYWFAMIKVATIAAFIVLGAACY